MRKISLKDFKKVLDEEEIYYLQVAERICSNRYIILDDKNQILLIDAGDGKDLLDFLPKICILTHGHFDHCAGVQKNWTAYISENEDEKLPYMFIPKNTKKIEQKIFEFGKYVLEVIPTPGHTPGSICLFEKNTKILFSGDTLFADGICGRTDLGGCKLEMKKSLELLEKLKWKVLCPGHGELEYR
ncbi:MAG: MBL fold metallo-hydrolase [Candidatus Micrarchaeota archaeon]|nr:MBL fold metallo-hydrolase [Candidatus Micrarchaeota archaeon]